jgi:hypothetical protein
MSTALLAENTTSVYVMWWPARKLSKVGIAFAPRARLSQIRKDKGDAGIIIAAAWNVLSNRFPVDASTLEAQLHMILRHAGLQDSSNDFPSEWFATPWPATVELVEQVAQLMAPYGARLRRMQGVHG